MSKSISRRSFLSSSMSTAAAAGALAGLGDLGFLGGLNPVSAQDAALDPKIVRLDPEIEPLVRLLEDTPREKLLEEVAARIKAGTSYREVLAALLLAGVRNVQPRPSVGFKFHAVLVVNSAHIASLSSPDAHRWLPIFWALDHFKSSQARDVQEGNWTMAPVDESRVPKSHGAAEAFRDAMDRWDEEATDAAVAGFVRHAGAQQVFEEFFRYAARDFRSIGHKAIYVANSYRTLACIGWQHAEPVLRSLAYALLQHEGDSPAERDDPADRPWRENSELVKDICVRCQDGRVDDAAASDLFTTARDGSYQDASKKIAALLKADVSPQSIWDGLFEASAEMVARKPGIISLHSATSLNALHFMYRTSGDDTTRAMLLLQAGAFVPLFAEASRNRSGETRDIALDTVEPLATEAKGHGAVEEIFAELGGNADRAMRKTLAYLTGGGSARDLVDAARLLVFLKGNDAHDYKFSSAVLEDYYAVSPAFRDRFLAANVNLLSNARQPDNKLVARTRAALGA